MIVTYKIKDKVHFDLCRGSKVNIFDLYYDKFGKGSLQGIDFGKGLYECEVDYLIKNEWALNVSDIIWRRSKLGIVLNKDELQRLNNYIISRN